MIKIDNGLLESVGLKKLGRAEANLLLKTLYETLEMRVGVRIADEMSSAQLDEFERFFEARDDAGAFKWLEANVPGYKDIVQKEFESLKAELMSDVPRIRDEITRNPLD